MQKKQDVLTRIDEVCQEIKSLNEMKECNITDWMMLMDDSLAERERLFNVLENLKRLS